MNAEPDAAAVLRIDLERVLRDHLGLPASVAKPMAGHIADGLCAMRVLPGWRDIPRGEVSASRDAVIRRQFNGRNIKDLMLRHGVSRATVYRALQEDAGSAAALHVGAEQDGRGGRGRYDV